MKIRAILTSRLYLILGVLFLLSIVFYMFISGKMLEHTRSTKLTNLDEQHYLLNTTEKEVYNLYHIRNAKEWEENRRVSKMLPELKAQIYGSEYNYLFYSKNPKITILHKSVSTGKPYKFLFKLRVNTTDEEYLQYIEVEYTDNKITDFKVI